MPARYPNTHQITASQLRHHLLLTLLTLSASVSAATLQTAPIQNIKIPTYSQSGHRISLILGKEARYINNTEVHIKNLDLTLFTDDSNSSITTVLKAPSAQVHYSQNTIRAQGADQIHIRHLDTIELKGRDWTYDHLKQKITINHDVRVNYQASLPELLK